MDGSSINFKVLNAIKSPVNETTDITKTDITDFATYEDYLDTQVDSQDLFYLEDQEMARTVVELGYKGKEMLKRSEFEEKKKKLMEGPIKRKKKPKRLKSSGKDLSKYPLLNALAKREEYVLSGKLATIIFIRAIDSKKGHEISGYIDYGHRLKYDSDIEEYFTHRKPLLPKPTDLSYYNWKTQTLTYNDSSTFEVEADPEKGLFFRHKRDRKTIEIEPKGKNIGDNSSRKDIKTDEYIQVVLYEHRTRRKN